MQELSSLRFAVLNERANALLVTPHPFFNERRQQIIEFAARNKLPGIYPTITFAEIGGLMSYAPNGHEIWRRAAGPPLQH